ncbi:MULTISPECIES: heat-inducible transcriptional repressor HrcA [unclassified Modestobacter]|uniref:heat-inducible transcriptional repressor HrcA n=1 Tax=unclassified Modestobacter TaxID=2643866 RepID=UPI0022AADC0C|nr:MULTISPECIES: heat-inducible transcriptional repressor HrcA [unclassified Modestobacter]MCZ2824567.1 heat-inducible transcriptional repressor HrcA [Modestobacter sp. VKM Ac-2981]MCZ2853905.1 heat-inducible transcriptional repressor HrcA [Modestobacter sp. VKM Ac-2982]
MAHDDRRLRVLRAIVQDYVSTNDPVGSKALAARYDLGVSPATIRNDMAVLEEEGYITQPHTSAGRVPTDKGYRFFVDRLSAIKPLSAAERKAIEKFLDGAVDLHDVLGRSVRLLAQLTRQVAVVQYPTLARSAVRHLELVPLSTSRLLMVLITDTGRVEQRVVEVPVDTEAETVAELRTLLNTAFTGAKLGEASDKVGDLVDNSAPHLRPLVAAVSATMLETLVEPSEDRLVIGGTANLAQGSALDFPGTFRPLLEALEEQVVVLRLMAEVGPSTVTVSIGEENEHEALTAASFVSVGYGSGDQALGGLGVVGPTRMDYAGNIAAVRAVARYVGHLLAES